MKKLIEAWSNNANVKSDELCELFIALNIDWLHHCKWAVIADSDLNLKCNLTIKLVIEQACDEILFEVWFVRASNVINISCSEICFLMINRMKVFDNHAKQHDEIFILFLSFIFITDEVEVNRESLKITVFQYLKNLSWKLEICCNCEHKFEDSNFEKMIEFDHYLQDFLTFADEVLEICLKMSIWVDNCCWLKWYVVANISVWSWTAVNKILKYLTESNDMFSND